MDVRKKSKSKQRVRPISSGIERIIRQHEDIFELRPLLPLHEPKLSLVRRNKRRKKSRQGR